ncbi:MAG TPA: LLM class flavin-dependent oxidoreductase [Pseudolabrys sp.]|nr:LLM class flavin-dependent oxidoreductase [Pseudolabrys sp.]
MSKREMKLGLFLYPNGHHIAAWRDPGVPPHAATSYEYYRHLATLAEQARLDFIFIADGYGVETGDLQVLRRIANRFIAQLEPTVLLAKLAGATRHIGLVATASTSYNEPYHIARRFASLDHLSDGRAGWNIVTSFADAEGRNFGLDAHLDHAARYRRAEEFVDVVKGLWDSWASDAFLYDKEAALVFDPAKLHVLRHRGEHFRVEGPLNIPRTPQGRPVLVQAGSSADGVAFGARHTDVAFTAQSNLDEARAFRRAFHDQVVSVGRDPAHVPVVMGVLPVIGRTREEARAKLDRINARIHPDVLLREAGRALGNIDLSGYPIEGPVPEIVYETNGTKSRLALMLSIARRDGLTLRQLGTLFAGVRGHLQVIGTATDVADQLQHWFEAGAADGFSLMPATLPGGFEDFVAEVVPELQRRGLLRREYSGGRLRDHLGLPDPVSFQESTHEQNQPAA